MLFTEYLFAIKYFFFAVILASFLFFLSFLLVQQQPDEEKFSSYECGFNPFGDARVKFEVRFYLVAILFIIFDLELTFLFPWIIIFDSISFIGIFSMLTFLFMLSAGFAYEWASGALEWE